MSNLVGLSQQAQDLFSIEYQHIFNCNEQEIPLL